MGQHTPGSMAIMGARARRWVLRHGATRYLQDLLQITSMVVPLGPSTYQIPPCLVAIDQARRRRRGRPEIAYTEIQQRFTCRWHDPESGDCTIYSARPGMCRDYPYGQPCLAPGCTASEATP